MWWLTTVVLLSLALLFPTQVTAGSDPAKYRWQDGELLSRKTVPTSRGIQYEYVYRLRGSDAHYVVVAKEPLHVELQTPVKFAPLRRHVVIRDADGKVHKLSMLERRKRAFGHWQ